MVLRAVSVQWVCATHDWPLMAGCFLPPDPFQLQPLWRNFFEDDGLVQFMHRIGAYLLLALAVAYWLKGRRSGHRGMARWSGLVLLGVVGQGIYGIVTLVHGAPLELAIFHQIFALGLLWLALRAKFETAYPGEQKISA